MPCFLSSFNITLTFLVKGEISSPFTNYITSSNIICHNYLRPHLQNNPLVFRCTVLSVETAQVTKNLAKSTTSGYCQF